MRRDGWKTLDAKPWHDFVATIPPLPAAVKKVEWDEIEWVYGISSMYLWDAEAVVADLFSVLKPGGKLVLEQPDFLKARERAEWVFGDASHHDPLIMNRSGWTPDSLTHLLAENGFARVEVLPAQHHLPGRDFRVEAYR